jgi:hypothetical protein
VIQHIFTLLEFVNWMEINPSLVYGEDYIYLAVVDTKTIYVIY